MVNFARKFSLMRIIISSVFLLCIFPSFLQGQTDSTKAAPDSPAPLTKYFNQNQFEFSDSTFRINNSLENFQNYIPKYSLGNTGLPLNNPEFKESSSDGFSYYKNNYSSYAFSPANLNFYNTRTPYTDLFYVIGSKKEQLFKMTFSYNVKKSWNLSADFLRIRSEGNYLRQNTNDNCLALSGNYKSTNNRYALLAAIIYNSFKNAENGGIADDSTFEASGNVDKKLLQINLNSAKSSTTNANVFVKQFINLGKRSSDTALNNPVIPASRIMLVSSLDGNYRKYDDENPSQGYYANIYNDSLKTSDSLFFYKLENELSWKRVDNTKHRGFSDITGFGIKIKHQYGDVWQKNNDSTFSNLIAGAELYNTYSNNYFWWNLSAKYVVTGYNSQDYSGALVAKKTSRDSLNNVSVRLESKETHAEYLTEHYWSNNFQWNNEFGRISKNAAEINFSMKKYLLSLNAALTSVTNQVYFDNYAVPHQYQGTLTILSASVRKNFVLYNWHLNNKVIYQNIPDSSIIHLPELILEHSLYYEHNVLKKAMLLQVGASVYYTSNYYADSYMPATGEFYLQNTKQYGNYPFIDFFINASVKTVRVFIKVDHLNSGWNGNNYVLTAGYPYAGRTFKFGVSWKFYD
jgi:hypothetical protein